MNSKIVSSIIATAGVAVGVVGITMGGAASTPIAAHCEIPANGAGSALGPAGAAGPAGPATGAAQAAAAAVPAAAGTTPAGVTGSGDNGSSGSSGTQGNGGLVTVGTDGSNGGSLVDVNVNPGSTPGALTTPTLPSTGGLGDLGGLLLDLDAHANPNQPGSQPAVTVDGSVDNR